MNQLKKKILTNKANRGNELVEVAVERPNHRQVNDAQHVHGREFRKALESKIILKECLEKYLREQGLWDDDKQAEAERLTKVLIDGEKSLARRKDEHGQSLKLSEAKQIAFDMQDARFKFMELMAPRRAVETNTAQAYAENARFNYLVSVCTVYNDTGNRVFSSVDDYREHEEKEYAREAATTLAQMLFEYDPETEKKFPENAFLLKYKFVNEKLQLVDKQGRLVDREGRLIDEQGRFINEQGQLVDRDGNRVDEDGNYVFDDAGTFLDDDGNPVPEPGEDSGDVAATESVEQLVG